MDPGPNGKRPRLGSWSASSAPEGTSLPHPHQTHDSKTTPTQPIPPPSATAHSHHHSGPGVYQQQPYPPRHNSLGSGPPSGLHQHSPSPLSPPHPPLTLSGPVADSAPSAVHGHAQSHHSELHRRHLEQETLAPMQDHFRQLGPPLHQQQQQQQQQQHHHPNQSSPAALPSYHHSFILRDSVIKRDSGDEGRRPNLSTGHASDSLPPPTPHPLSSSHHHPHHPHHSTSQPPPPPPPAPPQHQPVTYSVEGQQRHMGYENGITGAPTPDVYRPSTWQAPTVTHQTPYEARTSFTPVSEQFYGVYASSSSTKKKNNRASQACEQCRQLKAKCDEHKPCKTCRDKGTQCLYRDPVPKATDKAQADILQGLKAVQSNIGSLLNHVQRLESHLENRLSKLESCVSQHNGGRTKSDSIADEELRAMHGSQFPAEEGSEHHYYDETPREYPERPPMQLMAEDELEQEPGELVPPGEPAIPMNHTTLAGLLLNWPVIRDIVRPHLEPAGIRHVSEYPISTEQNRGVLIVYGRGEDSHPSRPQPTLPIDHCQLDLADDSSDTATSSPLAADWGHLGGMSPADQFVEYKGGVLASDGNPDFSEQKVWSYVQTFQDHILNMHPIIQPKVLREWVQHFLESLPPRSTPLKPSKAAAASFAVNNAGSKRKRSPASDEFEVSPTPSGATWGRPERSIHNALILTILALGKVCQHREYIPDAVHQTETNWRGSPLTRNALSQSPAQGSPPSLSSACQSSGLASPREPERSGGRSRRSSVHGSGNGQGRQSMNLKKNYEVIPGLEYFAFATDILGNHIGAYKNMKNVYALIFAGLYHGQLARPMESFAFIHQAGHKLQVIMRPSLQKLRRLKHTMTMIHETKYNQLALAFWTCLQLESDLIAELQLPPSGLLSYEDDMPHPNMSMLEGFDQKVLDSYPAQLYLRTHLNCIHRMFYAPDKSPRNVNPEELDPKFNNVGSVADAVSDMKWVTKTFAFKEDDPPAGDLLTARLRAKYWGAQVITYRPFIRQILHWSDSMQNNSTGPGGFPISEFRHSVAAPVIDPSTKSPTEIPETVKEYAKRGIKALIESTRALHNLGPERPIITNVFGTAHAQWGNLLVLSACSQTNVLRDWVPMDLLQVLFARTISFLRQSSTLTGCLRSDMLILEGVSRDLFGHDNFRTSGSFSSNTALHTPQLPMAAPLQHVSQNMPNLM
ncbi:hypothetical protein E4U43_006683 [Claviceps pusilla]|uniref:Zn(2)-C6 fungal-type domain-containing protein n=1 Tax=Claviceps pusilla TaxID=123648 RepID=A0A9P7T234_9HYPO|nr:hypothetical protein E4U43_006683 [Claviceps pusilla]